MVLAAFSIQNKRRKISFFENTFLLTNTSIKIVIWILFLTFLSVDKQFVEKEFEKKKSYITVEILIYYQEGINH